MIGRIAVALVVAGAMVACSNHPSSTRHILGEFPVSIALENGDTLDSNIAVPHVLGALAVTGDGYVVYQYMADTFLLYIDPVTKVARPFAPKGEGPGEVTEVTVGFGQEIGDEGEFTVFDSNRQVLYVTSLKDSLILKEYLSFPDQYSKYAPYYMTRLNDGSWVSPRGDFRYGMVSYNPGNGEVSEWPLGYEFENPDKPDYEIASLRAVSYSKNKGLIAEVYELPVVIVHDESGDVVGTFEYNPDESDGFFCNVNLTDNHIWALYMSKDDEKAKRIFVFDYDGNPEVELQIPGALVFAIDPIRRKLITVNPNAEEANAITYDIPEAVGKL